MAAHGEGLERRARGAGATDVQWRHHMRAGVME